MNAEQPHRSAFPLFPPWFYIKVKKDSFVQIREGCRGGSMPPKLAQWLTTGAGEGHGGGGTGPSRKEPYSVQVALVRGWSPVPKPCPEVVAARHEAGVRGRVHDAAHNVVVAQGEQVSALGGPRVPAAETDGPLIRQQHVVLRVVEDSLRPVHLPPAQASTCTETERLRAWTPG